MTEPLRVEGYVLCPCGRQVLEHVAHLTKGVCFECFLDGDGRYIRELEIANRGRRISVRLPSTTKRGPKKSKKTKKLVEHAKRAALRRTRMAVPDVYDLFYALEREARGLPALPLRKPEGHFVEVVETLRGRDT